MRYQFSTVLVRTSYHSFTAHFCVPVVRGCCWPQGFHFSAWTNRYRVYCITLRWGDSREMFRRRTHRPDSSWSWFACVCASIYQASSLGFSLSFGIMLPELMKQFDEGRQKTGEWISQNSSYSSLAGRTIVAPNQPRSWPAVPSTVRKSRITA